MTEEPDSTRHVIFKNAFSIADRPDGWLLREWKLGNERAAGVLFERYAIRLAALVTSRLNRRYRSVIDPDEIVQSAMGSFFQAARLSRLPFSNQGSLWRLLATFARRKMARSIERSLAVKRGGNQTHVTLDEMRDPAADDRGEVSEELIRLCESTLPNDLWVVVEHMLRGGTQREVAQSLGIDERTVRRRLLRVRQQMMPQDKRREACPPSETPVLPKVSYNRFVLAKWIGSGGFGKVYRASMQDDGRIVAVKFLRRHYWGHSNVRQTFLREICLASQIRHPNVIRYLGYGESPHGGPYVISQWIDGKPMHEVSQVSDRRFIVWLRQICRAIQAVHEAGLVHGDLTPGNILVDDQDRITVTDFGFSQPLTGPAAKSLGGTLGFAAPEQVDPAFGAISEKTDLYAIGGLVHWFVWKRPPHSGRHSDEALCGTVSSDELDPFVLQTVSPPFRRLMAMTLRKSPSERTIELTDVIDLLD